MILSKLHRWIVPRPAGSHGRPAGLVCWHNAGPCAVLRTILNSACAAQVPAWGPLPDTLHDLGEGADQREKTTTTKNHNHYHLVQSYGFLSVSLFVFNFYRDSLIHGVFGSVLSSLQIFGSFSFKIYYTDF